MTSKVVEMCKTSEVMHKRSINCDRGHERVMYDYSLVLQVLSFWYYGKDSHYSKQASAQVWNVWVSYQSNFPPCGHTHLLAMVFA